MFLQYFIWGSWYVSMGTYLYKTLKFSGEQIGLAYGAFAIGAMISPFFVGLIADRYFSSEKLLAILGILGGALLFMLPKLTTFGSFYPVLIIYCASYVPTLALGNSLSLHHLADPKRDFPLIKTLSAVGWIAGGVTLSLLLKGEQSAVQFYLAGAVSIALGLFSLTLPHTPPKKTGQNVSLGEILGLDALALFEKTFLRDLYRLHVLHLHSALFLFREHEYVHHRIGLELYGRKNVAGSSVGYSFSDVAPVDAEKTRL